MWKLKLFYKFQGTLLYGLFKKIIFWKWRRAGCPLPAPYTVKRETIKKIAQDYECRIFVETGTFLGATTGELVNHFQKLYTIELSYDLYKYACSKLEKFNHVTVMHGDSGVLLFDVIKKIDSTVLFWLDGHYSGGITAKGNTSCPIYNELEAIFQLKDIDFVIMIDDARYFINQIDTDYPPLENLLTFVDDRSPIKLISEIELDIISFKPVKGNQLI